VVDIPQVLEGAAYVGFIVGAIFAVLELHSISKDRKTDLMLRINEFWGRPEWYEAITRINKANFKDAKEAEDQCSEVSLMMVTDHLDGMASLARQKAIDPCAHGEPVCL
jgi:hypothetical protein